MGIISDRLKVFLIAGSFHAACYFLYYSHCHNIANNPVADNMYQRSELDYLIYNDSVAYADLIMNGDPVKYLKTVTVYKPFEN